MGTAQRRTICLARPMLRSRGKRGHHWGDIDMRKGLFALVFMCASWSALAHDHPPGEDSNFLNTLERPDNDKYPSRRLPSTHNSLLCCTDRDAVKVKFRME